MIPGIETTEEEQQEAAARVDAMEVDDATDMDLDGEPPAPPAPVEYAPPPAPDEESVVPMNQELQRLRQFLKYYTDGIRFIRQIESTVPTLCELLASNVKGEVVESMHFFVEAHRLKMECAEVGVAWFGHLGTDRLMRMTCSFPGRCKENGPQDLG